MASTATKQTTLERFANFDKHTKKLSEMKQKKSQRQSSALKQTTLKFKSTHQRVRVVPYK